MPRPQKNKPQVYSLREFKSADRLDKIRMRMMEPEHFELNEADEEYLGQLTQAYQACFEEIRIGVAIKWIQENIPGCGSDYKANRVLQDCYELFAPFVRKNKELRRHILVEKFYFLAAKAEEDEDWQLAGEMYSKAGKFEGLDKNDDETLDAAQIAAPQIIISNNPALLRTNQIEDAEFADQDE